MSNDPLEFLNEPYRSPLTPLSSARHGSRMMLAGIALCIVAALFVLGGLFMDTSVPTGDFGVSTDSSGRAQAVPIRVHNLGLMQIQTLLVIGGGLGLLSGVFLIGFAAMVNRR